MMMRICLTALVLLLSGCSLFGDRFRDRSLDYLTAKEQPLTVQADGTPVASVDRYRIPPVSGAVVTMEKFELPAPLALVIADDQESASLNDYRSESLNPRLEHDGSGALILRLDGGFAQAWTAVTDAIAASSLKMTDLNRSTGTWYLDIEAKTLAKDRGWWARLWNKDKVESKTYLLKMNRARLGAYLSLLSDAETLASDELNSKVLNEIKQQLEK